MNAQAQKTARKGGYRLADASSPYLRSHKDNPVEWYPWCDKAFEAAKKADKPVFLSVGYSACHWCHVMAEESFEDREIASLLNQHFISIKVDREERPDIDSIYMQAVQAMSGSGGWPMSVFLTPDKKPFYGGTYFPPHDSRGHAGFDRLLLAIIEGWTNRRDELTASAENFTSLLARQLANIPAQAKLDEQMLHAGFRELRDYFDRASGGFDAAPKFPQPGYLSFLLTYWYRTREPFALEMVEKTLQKMAAGGIYDHLGGGFHRYATDAKWQVPHYEKMLYDQSLLTKVYLSAFQITGDAHYEQIARQTLDYMLSDLQSQQGGFYSAEDADSEGEEGKFYTWSKDEIFSLLEQPEQAAFFCEYYGISDRQYPLSVSASPSSIALKHSISTDKCEQWLDQARRILLTARAKRVRPSRDEKIITAWNGMAISACALGGFVLNESRYITAAQQAADFCLRELAEDDQLKHHLYEGQTTGRGNLEDYAFFAHGLLDLACATGDDKWLSLAQKLTAAMIEKFHAEDGSFYLTDTQTDSPLMRYKPDYDGVTPSGNSAAASLLLRLGNALDEQTFIETAETLIERFSGSLEVIPTSLVDLLTCLDYLLGPADHISIVKGPQGTEPSEMLRALSEKYLPRTEWTLLQAADDPQSHDKTTAYICTGRTCSQPITDIADFKRAVDKLAQKGTTNA